MHNHDLPETFVMNVLHKEVAAIVSIIKNNEQLFDLELVLPS